MNPMDTKRFDIGDTTAMLARTPAILAAWLEGLPDAWLDASEGPGTFSPRDVVGHLIHGERTDWLPRLRRIREDGESNPFDPFDRTGFQEAIRGRGIEELIDEFAHLRRANLEELASFQLQGNDLAARGRHPALGPVTVEQLLATWVTHDLNHLGQIARVMAKRHDRTVGPWKEYLGILHWETRRDSR